MKIAVLGAGAWGTSIGINLCARHEVRLWARDRALIAALRTARVNQRYLPGISLPSSLGLEDDPLPIKEGFEQARGFFRTRVGRALQLRRVPDLRFRHDTSARHAVELGKLIDDARGTGRNPD